MSGDLDGEVAFADGGVSVGGDAKSNVRIRVSKSGSRRIISAAGNGGRAGGGGHFADETLAQPLSASAQTPAQCVQFMVGTGLFLCGKGRGVGGAFGQCAFRRTRPFALGERLLPKLQLALCRCVLQGLQAMQGQAVGGE